MRVDAVILDTMLTLKQLVLAMDNRLTAIENFAPEGVAGEVLMSNGPNTPPSYQALDAEDSVVTSVFGRSGAVIAQTGDYEFDQIALKPTTLAGYGITDAYTKLEVDALLAALSLTDLDDVVITAPVVTQVVRYDGASWVNAVLAFSDLSGSIANGQVPQSAVTQHQAALSIAWSQITATPTTLVGYGITDAYTQAQVDALLATLSLTDLDDVVITAPVTGEVIRFNGVSWVDAVLAPLDLSGWPANAVGVLTNDGAGVLTWGAAGGSVALNDLTDVIITGAASKEVLAYNGTNWVDQALDASYVGPSTFPTGAGQYIIDESTGFNTSLIIESSAGAPWSLSIRGYNSLGTWVAAMQIIDLAGTQYSSFGKASSSGSETWVQSYQGGIVLFARAGDVTMRTDGLIEWVSFSGVQLFSMNTGASGLEMRSHFTAGLYDWAFVDAGGTNRLRYQSNADRWEYNAHINFSANNTFDIGGSGGADGTVRDIYIGGDYFVDGLNVMGSRKTGWTSPTGLSLKTTFDSGTVTLPNLAARVHALIDDLIAHGMIGA